MNPQPVQLPKEKKHYQLQTLNLKLVPYRRSFVEQYHSWFISDPELLFLTGSQPLSLEQELQNHKSWLEDPRKYTFIIFTKKDNKMIGDINLFFSQWIEDNQAQINVMIAVKEYRGKGYAGEAVEAIEAFAVRVYGRDTIIAKIKEDNMGSIKLFEKLGYSFVQDNTHYKQKEYRKTGQLSKQCQNTMVEKYKMEQVTNIEDLYK